MRVALHSVLRPGTELDYDREHERIPDDLVASFARVGIHEWTIWRVVDRLFHLVECDDFDAAMRALASDPANERWQAHIGRFVDRFAGGTDGQPAPLPEVWDLGRQRHLR
ncbi:L-rhamnose mutarotase [Jiangella rhizosphaerae]|uniref:L-rhamnose mutarotase n=1 Tax=Jiangella rhizosphaerae TaxID=2293569 RepID=A0A418KRN7_9ACTN|nr:L-rhamnose mutarotase [Jiangella rhizosphaerae]RIQ24368.1 L-rhamnose mutarotase [Jiangella rhizosphaerae]